MINHPEYWILFNLFVLVMLAVDLGVFNRKPHEVSMKEALTWSGVWILLALAFNVGVYFWFGGQSAKEFLAGYLIEKALSVDNIFVFVMIFSLFKVPALYQHKVLFWGIIGALVMRAAFIFAGVALMEQFHWMVYLFGALLIFTGIKMISQKDKQSNPGNHPLIRLFRRLFPVSEEFAGGKFFTRVGGRTAATPLFVVLLTVELTDLIFAVDSIPAILAITNNSFIVYTSNVFAILGLRALYFALAGIVHRFHYLTYGLSLILVFVGVKMMIVDYYKLPVELSLAVVGGILAVSVLASLLRPAAQPGA